jgi:uncharacterized protein (TIGR02145 family)
MKNYNLIFKFFVLTAILVSTIGYSQTVTIGSQVWTSTNLNVSTYRNGDLIPQVQDKEAWGNLTSGAWCYYENAPSKGKKYGKLYNWYAVNDPRGLAPDGYHIPTDADWITLIDYLGGEEIAGAKMKSLRVWKSDNVSPPSTNSSGFTGLPGGGRDDGFGFSGVRYYGFWWSSSEDGVRKAWSRSLNFRNSRASQESFGKQSGFTVRCLRD